MLDFRRLWLGLAAASALVVPFVGCSSSSGASSEPSPTLVTVSPSTFGSGVVCGKFEGAWKTYVATLIDVTDRDNHFVLGSSNPVDCTMPVSFSWVIPGHDYIAQVDGYDRDDLVPFGGKSTGSRYLVDPTTNEDVLPRWETQCGAPASAAAGDAGVDGSPEGDSSDLEPTRSYQQTNVVVRGCDPLDEVRPNPGETRITIDLSTVQGTLACGEGDGEIDRLRVTNLNSEATEPPSACGDTVDFSGLEDGTRYRFRVEAFESSSASVRWATSCQMTAREGVTLPAACDTLSDRGALKIDIAKVIEAAGVSCEADGVTYRAVLLGLGLGGDMTSCADDAVFNALAPSAYQVVVDGFDGDGNELFNAFCEGAVTPGSTTTASCDVSLL